MRKTKKGTTQRSTVFYQDRFHSNQITKLFHKPTENVWPKNVWTLEKKKPYVSPQDEKKGAFSRKQLGGRGGIWFPNHTTAASAPSRMEKSLMVRASTYTCDSAITEKGKGSLRKQRFRACGYMWLSGRDSFWPKSAIVQVQLWNMLRLATVFAWINLSMYF